MRSMLRFRYFSMFVLALLLQQAAIAGGGGPDSYGYTWLDSDSSGLQFRWVEIVGRQGATQLNSLADDNMSGLVAPGFPFHYYWTTNTFLSIGSNGWLSLGTGTVGNAHCFQSLPFSSAQSSNNTLAAFLCDLSFTSSYPSLPNIGACWYWTSPTLDSFVVTYQDVPFWKDDNFNTNPPDWIGANTFQVILSRLDSSITFQYLHLDRDSMPMYAGCDNDLMIGIENSTGQIGLTARQENIPRDSFAIQFRYPKMDTFEVKDAEVQWNHRPGSKGRFIRPGVPIVMETLVHNSGNVLLDSNVRLHSRVLSSGGNLRWTGRDTLVSMGLGADSVVTYANPCLLTLPGQYFFNTKIENVEDLNPVNDLLQSEIAVVDTTQPTPSLQYCLSSSTNSSTSWPVGISGDYGAGVYMLPPWDNYRIAAVSVYVVGNDGNPGTPLPAGFRVDVYEEDSLGMPGLLRSSNLITPANAVEDGWNTIYPQSAPLIIGKGFFVGWVQGGAGVGLGNEVAGPKSRQTWEIINSQWAPYRAQNSEDFLISVQVEPLLVARPDPGDAPAYLNVHPNPCAGDGQANWLHSGGPAALVLRELSGKIIWREEIASMPPGIQARHFSLGSAANGVYFLEISTKGGSVTRMVALER